MTKPYAAVICDEHGLVALSESEYTKQLARPDDRWSCPKCGAECEWYDESLASDPPEINLVDHLHRQREWSLRTFGPGERTKSVLDHIRKEMIEVEDRPKDLTEWIDIAILAFDGAWRAGWTPEEIAAALEEKQSKNESRTWPDWRTADPDKAIEHIRE